MMIHGIRVDKDGGVLCVDLAKLADAVAWRASIAQSTGVISDERDEQVPESCSACGSPTNNADGANCIMCREVYVS